MLPATNSQQFNPTEAAHQSMAYLHANRARVFYALCHHRNTNGDRLTFSDRPWLLPIYRDPAKHLVLKKCVQVGMTEMMICDMFALARNGVRGMYLMPDDDWVAQWVADRIDSLLAIVPEYKMAVSMTARDKDSRRMKTIYGQTWKFAGTHATTRAIRENEEKRPKAAFEFAAGALIIDEHDEHEQDHLDMFRDRLAAAKEMYIRELGNPTSEGYGIAAKFVETDAKKWHVDCEHCHTTRQLNWTDHFVKKVGPGIWTPRDNAYDKNREPRPVCDNCDEPFNRLGRGHWHVTNPDGVGSGYEISRLHVGVRPTDIRELLAKWTKAQGNQSKLQKIYNQWLGESYVNEDEKLTESVLQRCASDYVMNGQTYKRCVAGLDQGKYYHLSISQIVEGKRIKRHVGHYDTLAQVQSVLDGFDVVSIVIDAQGGSYEQTRKFVETYDGAYMCYYRPKDEIRNVYTSLEKDGVIKANRTEACDSMVASYKHGLSVLPSNWRELDGGDFKAHMLTPQRLLDARGYPKWTKGVDHYFHADVYEWLAWDVSGIYDSDNQNTNWRS